MVMLKVLTAATLAITLSRNQNCIHVSDNLCDSLLIITKNKTLKLGPDQFALSENQIGFQLTILDKKDIKIIKEMVNPVIDFCFRGKKIESKGNPIFESSVPKDAESFYGLSKDNKISFSNVNEISMAVVNKVTHSQ